MDKSISVVVFYESHDVKNLCEELLGNQVKRVLYSDPNKGQKEFIKFANGDHQGLLFIYAFDDPKFAVDLCELLHRHESLSEVMKTPHISMLLCSREYRNQAYIECAKKRFFCYETIKPVYDMNRVRLYLGIASEFLLQQIALTRALSENKLIHKNLSEMSIQLEDIEESITDERGIQGALLDELTEEVSLINKPVEHCDSNRDMSDNNIETTNDVTTGLKDFKDHNQSYFTLLGEDVKKTKLSNEKPKPLIIVADDQKMMLKIISTILIPKGFLVETASNGAEVLMKAKVFDPQVILLDIDMPILNGIDTLKACKKLDQLKSVPVIMLTSNSDKHSFMECRELGAIDYIVKPTNANVLIKKIMAVL